MVKVLDVFEDRRVVLKGDGAQALGLGEARDTTRASRALPQQALFVVCLGGYGCHGHIRPLFGTPTDLGGHLQGGEK